MRRKTLLTVAYLAISIMIGGCTSMQTSTVITPKVEKYPDKPITLIVPWSAGSALDLVARLLEKSALHYLGQPLVAVNKPGGNGAIGLNELVTANPDGYTVGTSSSELFLNPIYGSSKYNYTTALDPLVQISATPVVIVIQNNQPWQNINDLVVDAKKHPGRLKFGHVGVGSLGHVLGEDFAKKTDITLKQVPFQGSSEVISALLGGHIQLAIVSPGAVKEYIKSGDLKILAVSGENRLDDPILSDAQTFREQGIDIIYNSRFGIAVPKDIPIDVKTKLVEGLRAMITDLEFKQNIKNLGLQYEYLGPEESQIKWLSDSKELAKDVQETGILEQIKSQKQ